MTLRPRGTTSPIYLSNKVPYLEEYGTFYTAAHAREDLPKDVHYYTPDEFDLEKPARTLVVVPVNEQPSPELLASHGWTPLKTVSEPTGQPVCVIYEKK